MLCWCLMNELWFANKSKFLNRERNDSRTEFLCQFPIPKVSHNFSRFSHVSDGKRSDIIAQSPRRVKSHICGSLDSVDFRFFLCRARKLNCRRWRFRESQTRRVHLNEAMSLIMCWQTNNLGLSVRLLSQAERHGD